MMDEMKALLNAILENQKVTNAKLEALTLDVRKLQGDMAEVRGEIAEIRGELAEVKKELAEVKSELAEVKSELAEVKKDLADFRYETRMNFNRFDRHMRAIESDLDHAIDRIEHVEQSNG